MNKSLVYFCAIFLLVARAFAQWPTPSQFPGNVKITGPSPWIDVMASGATGNGTTDDTVAIQAALTAMAATGGTVFFPCGTYLIGEGGSNVGLTIANSRYAYRLIGQASTSWGSSTNQCARLVTSSVITILTVNNGTTNQQGGTIEHLAFVDNTGGGYADNVTGVAIGGIHLYGTSWAILSDLEFDHFNNTTSLQGYGIYDDGGATSGDYSNHNLIFKVKTDDVHYGVLVGGTGNHDGPDIAFSQFGTSVNSTPNYGIYCAVTSCAAMTITEAKGTISDSANAGTALYLGGSDVTVEGFKAESYRSGGKLTCSENSTTTLTCTNTFSQQAVCAGIANGNAISGTNIPGATTVSSCSGSSVVMSAAATATASGIAVTVTVGTCCQGTAIEYGGSSTRNQLSGINTTRWSTSQLVDSGATRLKLDYVDISSTTGVTNNSSADTIQIYSADQGYSFTHLVSGNPVLSSSNLSACGTSPTLHSGSSDNGGYLQVGTGSPTSCTLTFNQAFNTAPFCTANAVTSAPAAVATGVQTTTTTMVLTFASTPGASGQVYYQCGGQ
jgi:hypothetical protein